MVVLEDAANEDCTVWVCFEPGADRADEEDQWEGLLARRLAPDSVRICAVPVFPYDLNLGDEVAVMESGEGALVATHLVRDAGNFTFRVMFVDDRPSDEDERWRELMVDLEPFDCWFDVFSKKVVALSAPPATSQAVVEYLVSRERLGELRYEAGRTTVPPPSVDGQ